MSKLLRSELKDIVKECLVEILAEGIGPKPRNTYNSHKQDRVQKKQNRKVNESQKKSYLDNIVYNKVPNEYGDIPTVTNTDKRVLKTNITSDPTLNAILADTAKSTLQEQLNAERRGGNSGPVPNDPVSKMVNQSNPEDLFGASTANKWAQLAFFDEK